MSAAELWVAVAFGLARELETERALAATLAEWRKQKDHG